MFYINEKLCINSFKCDFEMKSSQNIVIECIKIPNEDVWLQNINNNANNNNNNNNGTFLLTGPIYISLLFKLTTFICKYYNCLINI